MNTILQLQKRTDPKQLTVILALVALYVFWGGTYLGMRVAIETMPPFLMAGIRFVTAGIILYLWGRKNGAPRPAPEQWRDAAIIGTLLLLTGNGVVAWAEQSVPSGIASLLIATVPLWIFILGGRSKGQKSNLGVIAGILLGLTGIAFLVIPVNGAGSHPTNLLGILAILAASLSWSVGSLYSRKAKQPETPLMGTAMQMLIGGVLLLGLGFVLGEGSRLDIAHISVRSWLALGYLIVFGSIVGFNSYIWLLKNAEPTWVSTYAFVNPVVAVFLGWLVVGEALGWNSILATVTIVTAVIIITVFCQRKQSDHA